MPVMSFRERSQIATQLLPAAPYKERLRKLHDEMLEVIENRVQVAWRVFDGEGGYDYVSFEDNENYADEWNKRNPNHVGWVEPLFI